MSDLGWAVGFELCLLSDIEIEEPVISTLEYSMNVLLGLVLGN